MYIFNIINRKIECVIDLQFIKNDQKNLLSLYQNSHLNSNLQILILYE